ncbi:Vitamin B12 import ATP-binding protein BtuD [bioreactor metagenome]|uniref:Vitamin B12 import ATP-binding protein BtuD n=1 Tax=bioreactor metagenome TaxID=1076179 RepID=A0A644ZRI6_9ZZZZ
MISVIQVDHLQKNYGEHIGIRDVTFSAEEGEILGFVGPNGAGKSTTIRTLMGFIFASGGTASIDGLDCGKNSKEIKAFTGYVPSEVRLYGNMRVKELLGYNNSFYGNSVLQETSRLCQLFEVDTSKRFRELSTGNKKKVSIVCALCAKPKAVILDEPTSGLDPLMRKALFEELRQMVADGMTVLLSSHDLAEVEEYCDRVAFIRDGTIIAVSNLKESVKPRKIIRITGGNTVLPEGLELLRQEQDHRVLRTDADGKNLLAALSSLAPDDFTVENERMEERFWDLYGKGEKA